MLRGLAADRALGRVEGGMGITRPYRRTCRQLVDGSYAENGNGQYISHSKFATAPEQYIRAFGVLQKDFLALLDYIEPSNKNLTCYSYRTHELLMRACIEIEANFKGIFADNGYLRTGDLDMTDYRKLNATHRLGSYRVKLPVWHGPDAIRKPFAAWVAGSPLKWYQAYNKAKHNRRELFHLADFEAVVDAMCGLVSVLSAQFMNEDFGHKYYMAWGGKSKDGFDIAIGDYFLVGYPDDWPEKERYDFDWQKLKGEADPFQQLVFS